jgi:hypothetical protein
VGRCMCVASPFGNRARASADEPVDLSAARGAELQHWIRHLLAPVKSGFTRFAKIFVGRHRFSQTILSPSWASVMPGSTQRMPEIADKRRCTELDIFSQLK